MAPTAAGVWKLLYMPCVGRCPVEVVVVQLAARVPLQPSTPTFLADPTACTRPPPTAICRRGPMQSRRRAAGRAPHKVCSQARQPTREGEGRRRAEPRQGWEEEGEVDRGLRRRREMTTTRMTRRRRRRISGCWARTCMVVAVVVVERRRGSRLHPPVVTVHLDTVDRRRSTRPYATMGPRRQQLRRPAARRVTANDRPRASSQDSAAFRRLWQHFARHERLARLQDSGDTTMSCEEATWRVRMKKAW